MREIGGLRARTREVDDPGDLLALAAGARGPLFYWEHPAEGHALLALGVVREIRTSGPDRFATTAAAAARVLATVETPDGGRDGLRVVGGFGFSERRPSGAGGSEYPPARVVLPRTLWVRAGGRTRCTEIWDAGDPLNASAASAGGVDEWARAELRLHAAPVTVEERVRWRQRVAETRVLLAQGDVRKVVLARQRRLTADAPIDPAVVLARARAARPRCFNVWVRARGGTSFVASTPELLVRRTGTEVTASALAGSAPRGTDPVADRRLAEALLACPKNAREHAIVVAAVRDALAAVASDVRASSTPDVLRLPEAQHLATTVAGRLCGAASVLDLGGMLHPTPAVCGAPRDVARAIIERDEPDRGWYTGALGWMDAGGDGELVVALRSALVAGCELTVWGGAGIVEGSDADAELAETEAKMGALVTPFLARPAARAPALSSPDAAAPLEVS